MTPMDGAGSHKSSLNALCAMGLVLLACRWSATDGSRGEAPVQSPASASAVSQTCIVGTVADCAACGDDCGAGTCRNRHCEKLPKPFARGVKGTVWTFTGSGFVAEETGVAIFDADGTVRRIPRAEMALRPVAWFAGNYYGIGRGGKLLSTNALDASAQSLGFLGPTNERAVAADASGAYVSLQLTGEIVALRGGKRERLGNGPKGPRGKVLDLAAGQRDIFWVETEGGQAFPVFVPPHAGYLKALRKEGGGARLVATGTACTAVTTQGPRVYYADGAEVRCILDDGSDPMPVLRLTLDEKDWVAALGTTTEHLYLAAHVRGGNDLYRVTLPRCAPGTTEPDVSSRFKR